MCKESQDCNGHDDVAIRNFNAAQRLLKKRRTNIEEKVVDTGDDSPTRATMPGSHGGKHRSAPTGIRHVSKLCDDLLQQFADEFASPEIGLSKLQEYFASLRKCTTCGAMKPPDGGLFLSSRPYSVIWRCRDCRGDSGETVAVEPDDGLSQNVLF